MNTAFTATFLFLGSLNDFLSPAKKQSQFDISFRGSPAIKDVIESIGVPHPEIHHILVNLQIQHFSYHLKNGDKVEVFPFENGLLPFDRKKPAFILDVHLGKLAKFLRMMGFDSLYRNDYSDRELVRIACEEKRILLTRDIGVLKYRCVQFGYWVRATSPLKQAQEIADHYQLCSMTAPLSRCIECNGSLLKTEKSKIATQLEPRTLKYFDKFAVCENCGRIYWLGSHVQQMKVMLKQICPQLTDSGAICQ